MRSSLRCFLILFLLFLFVSTGQAEEKKPARDERLNQLVTTTITGKRLHSVVAEIAAQTGVKISCGKSKDDWQVRDIPVVVIVKDMPLGKLLKNLAEAAHLTFGSEKLDSEVRYRIYRSSRQQKELDDFFINRHNAWLAAAGWDWDTTARLASDQKPEDDPIKKDNDSTNTDLQDPLKKNFAEVLKLLGADGRDRVLAGEKLIIKTNSSSKELREVVKNAAIAALANINRSRAISGTPLLDPEPDILDKVRIEIGCIEVADKLPSVDLSIKAPWFSISMPLSTLAMVASNVNGIKASPRPSIPLLPEEDTDKFNANQPVPSEFAEFWGKKAKIDPPKDKQPLLFSDMLLCIAEAYDIDIISEDFSSYNSSSCGWKSLLGKELPLTQLFYWDLRWSLSNDKAAVGSECDWPEHHRNLIPEALYCYLCDKANGDGITIEDALPIVDLTPGQAYEWISFSSGLESVGLHIFCTPSLERSLWRLYYHLEPEYRALVESDKGLTLQKLGQKWVKESLLPELLRYSPELPLYMGISDYDEKQAASTMDEMSNISLRLRKSTVSGRTKYKLDFHKEGQYGVSFGFGGVESSAFPCYTRQRLEQLEKQRANKEGTKPTAAKQ